jgi:hypothetical protein
MVHKEVTTGEFGVFGVMLETGSVPNDVVEVRTGPQAGGAPPAS